MSDDRLTVCETRELLTESLCRAQDCAADLVQEVSERDATIARLTAELAEARAALREHAENCDRCHERTATRSAPMPDARGAVGGWMLICDDVACAAGLRSPSDLPHADALRAARAR